MNNKPVNYPNISFNRPNCSFVPKWYKNKILQMHNTTLKKTSKQPLVLEKKAVFGYTGSVEKQLSFSVEQQGRW